MGLGTSLAQEPSVDLGLLSIDQGPNPPAPQLGEVQAEITSEDRDSGAQKVLKSHQLPALASSFLYTDLCFKKDVNDTL